MTTFTELNLQKLNSSQDGPRWAGRLVRAPWPEPTSAVKNGRKPPFSARDPYVSASYRRPRGGSRSPAAFGSLGIFLSVCVLCFALFLFPMRSSDAQGCDVAEMPFLWPCPHRTPLCAEGAGAGRPSACPAGQTPRAGSRALLTRVCSARRWRMCSPRLPPRGKSSDCSFYSHGRPVPRAGYGGSASSSVSYVTGPSESRKVGRESAEPGTCSFCSEPGGQGPRPALDSTESGLLLDQERNRAGPWAGCRGTGTPPTGQRPPWARASCLEPLPPRAPASTPPSLVDLSHRAPSGRQARCRAPWHCSGRHMWPPSTPQGRDLSRNGGGWIGSAPRRWHCVGHERGGCK